MCYQHLVQAIVNNDVNNVIKLLTDNENQIKSIITYFKTYYLFYKAKSNEMITILINYFDCKRIIDISNILTSIIDCAIANGADIELIRRLVKRNANINGLGVQSISLSHAVKSKRNVSFIKELLEMGANVHEICDGSKNSVLHFAIINYCDETKLELVKLLIDYGADVNFQNDRYEIPLTKALLLANEDLCIELINRGSDINECNKLVGGNGILIYAFTKKFRSIDLIQTLITNGANVNAVSVRGCTPLFLAIENNYSADIIVKLIEYGADVNKSCKHNSRRFSPLLLATELKRDKEIVIALINHGADVNVISGGFRTTPLLSAIYHNYTVEVIDKLINMGADVNNCDGNGATPLIHAMNNDDKEIINRLISSGSDVNKTDYCGRNCLFFAVVQNNGPEIIDLLIDKGINTNIDVVHIWFSVKGVKINGKNSVKLFHNIKSFSEENYFGVPYLIHALGMNMSKDNISDIINIGANVNGRDREGNTPLTFSMGAGCKVDVIIKLLECGADVDFPDSWGRTPLMHTHRSPYFKQIIKILVDRGADVNAYDEKCNTPLMIVLEHMANVQKVDVEVLDFLLAKGANVNARNISGKTPLMFAVKDVYHNNLEIVNVLIKHGADLTAVDGRGCTVLCYGLLMNLFHFDDKIFHVLLNYDANFHHLCFKNFFQDERHLISTVDDYRDVGTINELLHYKEMIISVEDNKEFTFLRHLVNFYKFRKLALILIHDHIDALKKDTWQMNSIISNAVDGDFIDTLIHLFGCNINAVDNEGRTPLMHAVDCDRDGKFIYEILQKGGNPKCLDKYLNTPLHLAKSEKVVNLLIIYCNLDISAKNIFGKTPIQHFFDNYTFFHESLKHVVLSSEEKNYGEELANYDYLINTYKLEVCNMKNTNIIDNLTFYKFCCKLTKNEKNLISISEYLYDISEIKKMFPYYFDIISMKIEMNRLRTVKKKLIRNLENVILESVYISKGSLDYLCTGTCNLSNSFECDENSGALSESVFLNYDSLYCVTKYLSYQHVVNLFLASL